MPFRSAITLMSVLGGIVAGITTIVNNVVPGAVIVLGLACIVANRKLPLTHTITGLVELRGSDGFRALKSAELLSVSWQPPTALCLLAFAGGAVVAMPSTKMFEA